MKQYHDLPRDERALLAAVADAQSQAEREKALGDYCRMRQAKRLYQRRRGDDDRWRRTMLAIHVPFDYAMEVTARADQEGMSVYRWLRKVVDEAMRKP